MNWDAKCASIILVLLNFNKYISNIKIILINFIVYCCILSIFMGIIIDIIY